MAAELKVSYSDVTDLSRQINKIIKEIFEKKVSKSQLMDQEIVKLQALCEQISTYNRLKSKATQEPPKTIEHPLPEKIYTIPNGGSDGVLTFSQQCCLIAILDFLRLTGEVNSNWTIKDFRLNNKIKETDWPKDKDFDVHHEVYGPRQLQVLADLADTYNLNLFLLQKNMKEPVTFGKYTNALLPKPSRKNIVIWNDPGHFELVHTPKTLFVETAKGIYETSYSIPPVSSALREWPTVGNSNPFEEAMSETNRRQIINDERADIISKQEITNSNDRLISNIKKLIKSLSVDDLALTDCLERIVGYIENENKILTETIKNLIRGFEENYKIPYNPQASQGASAKPAVSSSSSKQPLPMLPSSELVEFGITEEKQNKQTKLQELQLKIAELRALVKQKDKEYDAIPMRDTEAQDKKEAEINIIEQEIKKKIGEKKQLEQTGGYDKYFDKYLKYKAKYLELKNSRF